MADEADDDRELGMDFGDLDDDLEEESYPLDADEVVDRYGDREIGISDGSESVEELLGPLNDTFQDAEEVRNAMRNMVGDQAIGRKGYSDRTPPATGEDEDQESF